MLRASFCRCVMLLSPVETRAVAQRLRFCSGSNLSPRFYGLLFDLAAELSKAWAGGLLLSAELYSHNENCLSTH